MAANAWSWRRARHRPLTPTLQQLGHESAAEDLSFLTQYLTQSNLTAQQRWEAMVRARAARWRAGCCCQSRGLTSRRSACGAGPLQKTETEEDRKVRRGALTAAATLVCPALTMTPGLVWLSAAPTQRKQLAGGTAASTATTQTFMQLSTDMQVRGAASEYRVAGSPPDPHAARAWDRWRARRAGTADHGDRVCRVRAAAVPAHPAGRVCGEGREAGLARSAQRQVPPPGRHDQLGQQGGRWLLARRHPPVVRAAQLTGPCSLETRGAPAVQIGYWIAVSVCITHDMKQRIKLLARFIELADECRQLGCYNTVFAMVAGLSNSLITRLKKTWAVCSAVAARRRGQSTAVPCAHAVVQRGGGGRAAARRACPRRRRRSGQTWRTCAARRSTTARTVRSRRRPSRRLSRSSACTCATWSS